MPTISTLARVVGTGFSAGIRTMTPVAAITAAAADGRIRLPKRGPFSLLARRDVALASACAAAGEWFIDAVLPLPRRTHLPTVLLRMSTGAVSGAGVGFGEGENLLLAAAIGSLASLGGTYGGFRARRWATGIGIPDLPVALFEDGLALSLSFAAVLRAKSAVA